MQSMMDIVALAINYPRRSARPHKTVTREELQARLAANPALVLLEALPEKYYNHWHLPGARHFPHDQARELAAHVVPEVVVYGQEDLPELAHRGGGRREQTPSR